MRLAMWKAQIPLRNKDLRTVIPRDAGRGAGGGGRGVIFEAVVCQRPLSRSSTPVIPKRMATTSHRTSRR